MRKYLSELLSWPIFTWQNDLVIHPLAETSRLQGRFLGRVLDLGFDLSEASLAVLTEDVLDTSAIEGESLDRESVRSSVARRLGIDTGISRPQDRRVEGIVTVLMDASQNFRAPLTQERLFGWHSALFPSGYSGLRRITVGDWRKGEMAVLSGAAGRERTHFVAPGSDRVAEEMNVFLTWFEQSARIDPLLKSALSHLYFVTIHPFEDGNGRIARAIADQMLARADGTPMRFYSLSSQIRRERPAYYTILEETQSGTMDVTAWLLWYLGCLQRAIASSETLLAALLQKARFWQKLSGVPLNPRQTTMLNRFLSDWEGNITARKWSQMTQVSQDTALRDLQEMIVLGVLRQNPGGGRAVSYSLVFPE